jgi:DegV family protein with EDD domain
LQDALKNAFVAGYERLLAWTDLLDEINVFPVADSDTGQNLKISLLPLGRMDQDIQSLGHDLMVGAVGNSGNIAAAFFKGLLQVKSKAELGQAVIHGKEQAWQAVADPQPGTMLSVYDEMVLILNSGNGTVLKKRFDKIINHLAESVAKTIKMQPSLQTAGVVDAGALGMFIYFEAFLAYLCDADNNFRDIFKRFAGRLRIKNFQVNPTRSDEVCVSTVVRPKGTDSRIRASLSALADNLVIGGQNDCVKFHFHTRHPAEVQERMTALSEVVQWSQEVIQPQPRQGFSQDAAIHIMTDAAGSMTRKDAKDLGVTLLDSCIVMAGRKFPETLLAPEDVYAAMRNGRKVGTAQTSLFQRHQIYKSAVSRYDRVLYLCVGSVYTGNYDIAKAFCDQQDLKARFTVIDTGAASGRLGIIARQTALFARECSSLEAIIDFAHKAMALSREYVFLNQLKYLAAGGRISKTRGFFGDFFGVKPIITPRSDGAVKVGTVRNRKDQLNFARKKLEDEFSKDDAPNILLQFSDNYDWVQEEVAVLIKTLLPKADILLRPLSLTSGAHMGPGTWSMAYLTDRILDRV